MPSFFLESLRPNRGEVGWAAMSLSSAACICVLEVYLYAASSCGCGVVVFLGLGLVAGPGGLRCVVVPSRRSACKADEISRVGAAQSLNSLHTATSWALDVWGAAHERPRTFDECGVVKGPSGREESERDHDGEGSGSEWEWLSSWGWCCSRGWGGRWGWSNVRSRGRRSRCGRTTS